ncbi:MAG: MFS transporter [Rhodoglobus sp.]
MPNATPSFLWRSIALPTLLPTLLFSVGEGAIIPIIPITANNLGATLAIAGLVAGALTIGELLGTIPSGWLTAQIGERSAMIGASLLSILGLVICVNAPTPVVLGGGVFLVGLATAVFGLARHAFMTSIVPAHYRARALSTLGGVFRLGYLIGPFIAAGVIQFSGFVSSAFWIHLMMCVATAAVLLLLRDPSASFGVAHTTRSVGSSESTKKSSAERPAGLVRTIYNNREVLTRLGVGAALIGALRASRQVILPLWAVSIGISEASTAVIIGIAAAVDFALFYVSGQIMDRFGRRWSALPSMIGLGLGHLVLALSADLDAKVGWFIAVALFLALANGLSSGILLTLGSDLAEKNNPAPFLSAWRFTGQLGGAGAPLAIAALTALASLSVAAVVLGALGLLGATVLGRYLPRFSP